MAKEWFTGRIIEVKQVTPLTRIFHIEIPEVEVFNFKPGQFVTFDLPIGEKPKDRWRSYSIASRPGESNVIELVIVYLEGGKGSEYLFNLSGPGTELKTMGPLGKFTLPAVMDCDICFICTGTGIAPFRSMLLDLIHNPRPHKNFYLLFGTRTIADILYYDEMKMLSQKLPELHYQVTLSRETSPDWTGTHGYVHPLYEKHFADQRPAHFYICGWKDMIDEARKRLELMGYNTDRIHLEIYG